MYVRIVRTFAAVMATLSVACLASCDAGSLKLAAVYPKAGTGQWLGFLPRRDGFIFPDGSLRGHILDHTVDVEMHDWSGHLRWRVTVPAGNLKGWKDVEWTYHSISASPDGHVLAAPIPSGPRLQVLTWRDGKLVGRAVIPMAKGSRSRIHSWPTLVVQNDGTILICPIWDAAASLFVVRGNQVIATGTSVSRLHPQYLGDGMSETLIRFPSTDGKALVGFLDADGSEHPKSSPTFERLSITVRGGHIALRQTSLLRTAPTYLEVLRDGTALSVDDGVVFRQAGRDVSGKGWKVVGEPMWETWVVQVKSGGYRMFAPGSGDHWPLPKDTVVVSCSADGRYAAVLEHTKATATADARSQLAIYERTGKLCAAMPLRSDDRWASSTGGKSYFVRDGKTHYINSFCLSADGHRLVVRAHVQNDPDREFEVFVW